MYEPPDVAAWNTAQKSSLSHEVLPLNQRGISSGKRTFRELHGLPIHLACISLSLYFTCSLNLRTLENQDLLIVSLAPLTEKHLSALAPQAQHHALLQAGPVFCISDSMSAASPPYEKMLCTHGAGTAALPLLQPSAALCLC